MGKSVLAVDDFIAAGLPPLLKPLNILFRAVVLFEIKEMCC